MPLFFAVSGYLQSIRSSRRSSLTQIRRNLISYGIPYLIFSVVDILLRTVEKHSVDGMDFVRIFLYPISWLWFLYALLIASVIHILLEKIEKSVIGKAAVLVVTFGIMAFGLAVSRGDLFSDSWLQDSIIADVCKYLFWYETGAVLMPVLVKGLSRVADGGKKGLNAILCAVEIAAFCAIVLLYKSLGIKIDIIYTLIGLAGIAAMVHLSMTIGQSRPLESLGRGTMEIYLLHPYVVSAVRMGLTKLHLLDAYGIIPLIVCGVLGVVIPVLLYYVIKRIKPLDFCFYPQRYIK